MLKSLLDRLKARRTLKRGWRLLREGRAAALAEFAAAHQDTSLRHPLQAMLAKCLADDDDREGARTAFIALHSGLKGMEDRDARYLKLFALFHLALIRNSLSDAGYLSRKARELRADRRLRALLPMPQLIVPPQQGPAITATM